MSITEQQGKTRSLPAFVIVGTPRSGTTLVQRLASELPGVRVPPETHFFVHFASDLVGRRTFPLDGETLRIEIGRFAGLDTSRGLDLDEEAIVRHLGGMCERPVALFGAIVRDLAGEASLYGEKTPDHLLWWRPLSEALPQLKIVSVVRDPRAVVNSYRAMPFGMGSCAALAERWNADQAEVEDMHRVLGPARTLAMRYEHIVEDPDGARWSLARFLGLGDHPDDITEQIGDPALRMPWETWKADVSGPVKTDRVGAWREELTHREAAAITAICRVRMARFGYPDEADGAVRGAAVALGPAEQWRRLHFRLARRRRLMRIAATTI